MDEEAEKIVTIIQEADTKNTEEQLIDLKVINIYVRSEKWSRINKRPGGDIKAVIKGSNRGKKTVLIINLNFQKGNTNTQRSINQFLFFKFKSRLRTEYSL